MAESSVIEYEIGVLVAQALDKVGDLVVLSTERVGLHASVATHSPQSLDMCVVQSALRPALFDAFESGARRSSTTADGSSNNRRPSSTGVRELTNDSAPTTTRLTTHQLQELGATFGRNPSGLGEVVETMWHSGSHCPDVTGVVTRSSPLLVA